MKVPFKVVVAAFGMSMAGVGCGGIYPPIIDDGSGNGGYGGSPVHDAGAPSDVRRPDVRPPLGGNGGSDGQGACSGTAGMGGSGAAGGSGGTGGHGPAPVDELVAHYNFDEGRGTTFFDSSPNRNDGVLLEGQVRNSPLIAAPTWVAGKKGTAYKFDGLNDFGSIRSSESINSFSDTDETLGMSLAAWVKFDSLGTAPLTFVISRQETPRPSNEYFGLGLHDGRPMVNVSHFFTSAPEQIVLGQWTHIAMTYDGIFVKLFVNGVLTGESAAGVTLVSDTTPVILGANENSSGVKDFANAAVDDVFMYSRELTEAEVRNVMNAGQ